MRILIVNKFYHLFGGTERYVLELTQLLERKGHQVIPFAVADARNEPTPYADYFVSPIEFFERRRRPAPWVVAERVIYSREARRKITQLIRDTKPDLAHIHNVYHHMSPSVLDGLRAYRIPTVMTLHDYKLICPTYSLWTHGRICERCRKRRYYHCVLQRCNHGSLPGSLLNAIEASIHTILRIYDNVDLFVAPSAFLRDRLVSRGWCEERIVNVPNFLVLQNYVPYYDHDGYYVYAGRLTSFKGVGLLLRAVARLRPSMPLLIAGDGPERSALEAEAARLELSNVHFLGHQPGPSVHDLVARAAFAVVPSQWYENAPYAVLEALALGTPVLATSIGGIPELIEDGVNGLLVAPGDVMALSRALEAMIASDDRLRQMGRAGRKRAEQRYSEEVHYSGLSEVYRRARSNWSTDLRR